MTRPSGVKRRYSEPEPVCLAAARIGCLSPWAGRGGQVREKGGEDDEKTFLLGTLCFLLQGFFS